MVKRLIIITAILFIAAGSLSAQSFTVFGLDASAFPTMKAKFYAFDASGQQQSPSSSDLTVTENGTLRQGVLIDCPSHQPIPRVSLAMSLDVSGSMGYSNFVERPVDLGKSTMETLVPMIDDPASEFALQTCNDHALIIQDFTTNRAKILTEISTLDAGGGNDFVEHLLNPRTGILNIAKSGKYKRVAVLYTDAWWDALSDVELQQCIDTCTKYSIEFFAIIYSRPEAEPDGIKSSLRALATATGGQLFDGIDSKQAALDVATSVDQSAQGASPCLIQWESKPECSAGMTTVAFNWRGQSVQIDYQLPSSDVAELMCSPSLVSILPTQVNVPSSTTMTVRADHASFTVTGITSSNPRFDINPKSFVLADGESKTLTITYTPQDSDYSWSEFDLHTDFCDATCSASASFSGYHSTTRTLALLKPNGGEVFEAGIDTPIVWRGIDTSMTVSLALSTDAGATWSAITNATTGGQYAWHVPNTTSNRCLVRVAQNSPGASDGWVIGAGGTGIVDPAATIADSSGNIYVVGSFQGSIDFGGTSLTSQNSGSADGFIAKYRPDGYLTWVKGIGGSYIDEVHSITIDHAGYLCVAGIFSGVVDFGGVSLTGQGGRSAFVATYDPNGSLVWVKDAVDAISNSDVEANGVAVDAADNVYITGLYTDVTDFGGIKLSSAGQEDMFVAKYSSKGTLLWVKGAGGIEKDFGKKIAVDNAGNCYVTGSFSWHCDFGITTLYADLSVRDAWDLFIAKYHSDGSIEWVKRAGGPDMDIGEDIGLDNSGNAYITGYTYGPSSFDSFNLIGKSFNVFLAKYAPDGTVKWVGSSTSGGGEAADVVVTPSGAAYVTGSLISDLVFGGTTLKRTGLDDAFVVKFASDGSPEWAKKAGGAGDADGSALCVDPHGQLYVAGLFFGRAGFDSDTLTSVGQNGNMFIWKMGTQGGVQADTSDAVFSIVQPQPASQDVDMGTVIVPQSRDSVVQTFIRNVGSYPVRVDSMAIVGASASQFVIASGLPPFVVPAGGAQRVEFHFAPTSVGTKTARILIFTQSGTLTQTITGTGIQPTVSSVGTVIDFGQLKVGDYKDTTIAVAIRNVGSTSIDFTGISQLGPDLKQFSVVSGGPPFTLASGASQTVTLRFTPKYIGRASGRIGFEYSGVGSPAVLTTFGQGLGGRVRIPDDSGYPGDHRVVPMILENVPVSSLQSVATNFQARVLYDASVLFPTSGTVKHGTRFDTLDITGSIGADSVLARIPFVAMLGESSQSPMSVVNFAWLDDSGQPADYDVESESGTFDVLGLCTSGGTRLFDPNGVVQIARVSPNPSEKISQIDIQTIENGRTVLRITDLLGSPVTTIFDGELKPGTHTFQINTAGLSAGSYYLTLTTPTVQRLQRIDIVK
ncbi:MAG: choice-of-anchor D domain-containing protein [Bacteroidetes bacterium]|nr:choice-of-anchor D domain-containing protein [Bacteroidota bacterium]